MNDFSPAFLTRLSQVLMENQQVAGLLVGVIEGRGLDPDRRYRLVLHGAHLEPVEDQA